MVGGWRRRKGSRMMMRKTSLILLGVAAGAAMTLLATQPRMILIGARAQAAAADTYRQLNLFGDVFERVRADYVEKPDDGSSSNPRSTACWRGSIRTPATWTRKATATCRCRRAANSAASASRSPWRKA